MVYLSNMHLSVAFLIFLARISFIITNRQKEEKEKQVDEQEKSQKSRKNKKPEMSLHELAVTKIIQKSKIHDGESACTVRCKKITNFLFKHSDL
jgi:hypothetical protein